MEWGVLMAELLKKFILLSIKNHRIKLIDKECDRYFKIEAKLKAQQKFINYLIDEFEKDFGEKIRTPKGK
jgi:hypothetical protein